MQIDTNSHTPRIIDLAQTSAENGNVVWAPVKSIWYWFHTITAIVGGVLAFSWSALLVFLVFTAATLCLGHSLGMHRRLIHNSYACPLWLEYFFVHLGVLVGMAGPLGMMHQHDLRDWAQRKRHCHAYLRHGKRFWYDAWWQLNCDLKFDHAPQFKPEARVAKSKVYQFMEKTWMWQQLPWAVLLFYLGGIEWLVWGISVRITVSITGHWLVGHFAHNKGERDWHIEKAAVQGYNVRFAGLITMGESWHNNHHAFPGSALLGLYPGQMDVGWWVLEYLRNVGLVWDIKLPEHFPRRDALVSLPTRKHQRDKMRKPRSCPVSNFISRR